MTIRILKTLSKLRELQGLSEATLTWIADQMTVEHRRLLDRLAVGCRPHTQHAIFGVQDDAGRGVKIVSHGGGQTDAQIDKPS